MFKPSKLQILGGINLLFGLLISFLFISSLLSSRPAHDTTALVNSYGPGLILLICLVINFYLAFVLILKKPGFSKNPKAYVVLTLHTIFWLAWLIIGYFFVSDFVYPIISLALVSLIFFFVKKLSLKLALVTSMTTIFVILLTISFAFEENYCWGYGDKMAGGSPASTVVISLPEAKKVFEDTIQVPSSGSVEVGAAAYYHFRCHLYFDLKNALKEKYLQSTPLNWWRWAT